MTNDETTISEAATAIADRPAADAPKDAVDGASSKLKDAKKSKGKKQQDDDIEYEYEFATPFGKLEFEFEPTSAKKRKEQEKREKAAEQAAKSEAKAKKQADKQTQEMAKKGQQFVAAAQPKGGGGKLLPILLIFAIVAGGIALAIWLFARPGDDMTDVVPSEFRNDEIAPVAEPQGFVEKARARIRDAVRAGRNASRDAQEEQQRKYEDMARGG